MKASCACQRAEEERLRAKEEARKRRAVEMEQVHATYGWLGYGLSDTILVEKTFKTFDVLRQRDAYQATLSFVDLMTGTFILHGSYGTGKTHLLAALTNELRIRGTRCRFCTAPRLFAGPSIANFEKRCTSASSMSAPICASLSPFPPTALMTWLIM